ncbi:MAG: hypothetical protein ACYC05_15450 [Sulfuricella sp.]
MSLAPFLLFFLKPANTPWQNPWDRLDKLVMAKSFMIKTSKGKFDMTTSSTRSKPAANPHP